MNPCGVGDLDEPVDYSEWYPRKKRKAEQCNKQTLGTLEGTKGTVIVQNRPPRAPDPPSSECPLMDPPVIALPPPLLIRPDRVLPPLVLPLATGVNSFVPPNIVRPIPLRPRASLDVGTN
eukprot:3937573-Rhodomonas_salina.1